jgi:hypothetical protein
VAAFQADILPLLEEIESGRERAQERVDRLVEEGPQALSRGP